MRNYLTFDNKDLRDFGVYITGQGTFRAPARVYDPIKIPNRNGDLLGIEDRLENLEIVYPAFIFTNFKAQVAALRAFLLSHKGYFILRDSYHPDEYRLAYYKGPFVPDVTANNGAGSFDLVFTCKPQRFLDSGDGVVSIIPGQVETKTYTGNPATFDAQVGDLISSLKIPLRPSQDLHGYANPWPAGGGDNKFEPFSGTHNGVTFTVQDDGTVKITGNATVATWTNINQYVDLPWNGINAGDTVVLWSDIYAVVGSYAGSTLISNKSSRNSVATSYTIPSNATRLRIYEYASLSVPSAGEVFDAIGHYYFAKANSFSSWTPYANICPISGLTDLSVYVSPTQDPDDATVYNVYWSTQAGTVYHGTVDPVAGQLTVDKVFKSFDGTEDWGLVNAAYFMTVLGPMNSIINDSAICSHYLDNPNISTGNYQTGIRCYNRSETPYSGAAILVRPDAPLSMSLADFKTWLATENARGTPLQVCYELATPVEYQITPVQIAALLAGETFIWASNNEPVTVEVSTPIPTEIDNPTLFDAKPLLRVYGTGTLGIASSTITISSADVYTDIDCELMDCYKGSANKNAYVVFSSNDFPVLKPGKTGFTFSGITQVDITPRWFSV